MVHSQHGHTLAGHKQVKCERQTCTHNKSLRHKTQKQTSKQRKTKTTSQQLPSNISSSIPHQGQKNVACTCIINSPSVIELDKHQANKFWHVSNKILFYKRGSLSFQVAGVRRTLQMGLISKIQSS